MQKKAIFRQAALDKLSSPEQLDLLMTVTTPRGWIALLALCAILLAVLVWSVLGRLPTTMTGLGIILKTGGIYEVTATGQGRVRSIPVEIGDEIAEGQVVCHIERPELQKQVDQTRAELDELQAKRRETARFVDRSVALKSSTLSRQQDQLQRHIDAARAQVDWLEKKVAAEKEALALGLVAEDALHRTIQDLEAARTNIDNSRTQLQELSEQQLSLSTEKERELFDLDSQIAAIQRRLELSELGYSQATQITSPYAGRVVAIETEEGALISPGTSLLDLEKTDVPLETYAFIKIGKKIHPGMEVQVSPTTVQVEEFGFMLGQVATVSEVQASAEGLERLLHNRLLAQELSAGGDPFIVGISLKTDAHTASGFRWSSPEGPPLKIDSGTRCQVRIVLRKERPISLVIPALKSLLGS